MWRAGPGGALTWRAGPPRVRRGAEATLQSRGWPTRGAGGAQGADTWQEATRVDAGPHERPCGGSAYGGPMG